MKLLNLLLTLGLTVLSQSLLAQTKSFDEVWREIHNNSPAIKSASLNIKASEQAKNRAARHWLPQVYLDAKSYQTNDPGASFFGLLQQRSLTQNDFNPTLINRPTASAYTRGALGINLPLYEGGMKTNQSKYLSGSYNSNELQASQLAVDLYAQSSQLYGSIAVLQGRIKQIEGIQAELNKLLRQYKLGSKSNPVGYSGLLGMKSLNNRLTGLLRQYKAQTKSYYAALNKMGVQADGWNATEGEVVNFVENRLLFSEPSDSSYGTLANEAMTKASFFAAEMEKARFLPQVGVFAEGYVFNGNRDTADGYTAGLYLRWNLFSGSDYGAYSEAKLKAQSASQHALALSDKEAAEKIALKEAMAALKDNLALLQESQGLLQEQFRTTVTLFRNGSINALQMVEVINRRVDLIKDFIGAELEYINNSAQYFRKEKVELNKII